MHRLSRIRSLCAFKVHSSTNLSLLPSFSRERKKITEGGKRKERMRVNAYHILTYFHICGMDALEKKVPLPRKFTVAVGLNIFR